MTVKSSLAAQAWPKAERGLDNPGIDRASIRHLVREFYATIRQNDRLGPIFAREIPGDWEPHLEKMTDFWRSIILRTGDYHGRPVPAHLKLTDVTEADFDIWMDVFRKTVAGLFAPDTAMVFVDRAERIATSLKLAMFFRLDRAQTPAGAAPDPAVPPEVQR
ncbi:group III truncated hemoglobin [Mesorhizobium sp. B2-4-12]|uniref:group III truncated hemoglobin n=1 Tax=Mesorhizobium sp. B2-4-12 TaxID=2589937 RepID=UPI001127FD17|nr:group III truncated hemoglobin [Mesorhizobium sp. B2-4-12]TPK93943.1 group III truncated hemoglobin [Mesorhizobium sp. B2-4-12]